MKPNNPPAFPCPGAEGVNPESIGMALRDYFAGQAMQGIVDRVLFDQRFEDIFCKDCQGDEQRKKKAATLNEFCAFLAYDMADKMLAARATPAEESEARA